MFPARGSKVAQGPLCFAAADEALLRMRGNRELRAGRWIRPLFRLSVRAAWNAAGGLCIAAN
jgi:hypothetical protein